MLRYLRVQYVLVTDNNREKRFTRAHWLNGSYNNPCYNNNNYASQHTTWREIWNQEVVIKFYAPNLKNIYFVVDRLIHIQSRYNNNKNF